MIFASIARVILSGYSVVRNEQEIKLEATVVTSLPRTMPITSAQLNPNFSWLAIVASVRRSPLDVSELIR